MAVAEFSQAAVDALFDGLTPEEIHQRLSDPEWRLSNLYYVLDKNGDTVLFKPNEVQKRFVRRLWYRNVVPKARQLGFSTVTQLVILDACLFVINTTGGIIAQDTQTAKGIRDNKIAFAYDRLPRMIRQLVPIVTDNVEEIVWANGSTLIVSNSARGRTLNWLHVSEYGIICKRAPEKANEIRDGSLPAVGPRGIAIIESTAEGRAGDFYAKVTRAKQLSDSGKQLAPEDYRLHFASWWDAEEYETDPELVVMSPTDHAYFERMEALIGVPLSPRKRAWYVLTRDSTFSGNQEAMWSQYPTTLEEAFQVSADGIYLSKQMTKARIERRIGDWPHRPGEVVNTFWDIGVADDVAVWFHQQIDGMDHWIDFMEMSGEAYHAIVLEMQRRGYVWGQQFLPHDANQRRPGTFELKTPADMVEELGLRNIVIVPRIDFVTTGINMMRDDFSTYRFNEPTTKEGLVHLEGYQKSWNERHGVWSDLPAKNGHQHAADALRQKAQAKAGGLITQRGIMIPGRTSRRNRSGMAA